ncbi:putative cysteine-rich receptor-like protein kinase 23 [Camellia sinensis]|uniref:putative cysteine-rich receptor-like protein kinase 23 n=1 Tax=Camellia sinensis TaxID=4442 RepID=UPI0010363E3A|nr:putative cysteine-rich receptor-like protein kinase 23 [Camellia sinensis]
MGSQFESNLKCFLIRSLYNNRGDSIFFNDTRGDYPDKVYGLFLCSGDAPASVCQNCIDVASNEIVKDCPFKKVAIIWYDECLIRYSYRFSNLSIVATSNPSNQMSSNPSSSKKQPSSLTGFICCSLAIKITSFLNSRNPWPELLEKGRKGKTIAISISITLSAFLVLSLLGACIYYQRRRKKAKKEEKENSQEVQLLDLGGQFGDEYNSKKLLRDKHTKSQDFPSIQLDLIHAATKHFSEENKHGEGGFGPVYKGTLSDGKEIAVKRLSRSSGQGLREFKNVVILIARLQHRNLVRLLGCCLEGD